MYTNIYYYYTNKQVSSVNHLCYYIIKKQCYYYWYDSLTKQLVLYIKYYYAICFIKHEIVSILWEIYDYVDHFIST